MDPVGTDAGFQNHQQYVAAQAIIISSLRWAQHNTSKAFANAAVFTLKAGSNTGEGWELSAFPTYLPGTRGCQIDGS